MSYDGENDNSTPLISVGKHIEDGAEQHHVEYPELPEPNLKEKSIANAYRNLNKKSTFMELRLFVLNITSFLMGFGFKQQ